MFPNGSLIWVFPTMGFGFRVLVCYGVIFGLYEGNGKENGNYYKGLI